MQAVPKRRMGRNGKLDFSADRVTTSDGGSIPLRYSLTKKEGGSHSVRTGLLTAGAAVVFWPAAPVFLLMKGKDVTVNRGTVFEVFTDQKYTLRKTAAVTSNGALPAPSAPSGGEPARLTITSVPAGADIHLDGSFVGNTPAVVPVAQGAHKIVVGKEGKSWERDLQVHAGSSVSLVAVLK